MSATWKYVIAYLLLIQLGLGLLVPQEWLYHHRVSYEAFKEDPRILDRVLDQIARQIKREKLQDYVILLGDSVGYSGPGGPEQSIGFYMEQISRESGKRLAVFNLALPAMQAGDIYVILLKLKERGIATPRVVINLIYPGFTARNPSPPIAFWLADELRALDPASWERFENHLALNERVRKDSSPAELFDHYLAPHISLLAYRPVLKQRLMQAIKPGLREVYDTRAWTEKPELPEIIADPHYQAVFGPAPFEMTEQNSQLYFLERIVELTRGSQVLFYLAPTNQALMRANVSQQGYQENLARIDAWFAGRPAAYLNLEQALDDRLFSDHIHLTPEGYQTLAGLLLQSLGR